MTNQIKVNQAESRHDGKARLAGKIQSRAATANAGLRRELEEMRWNRLVKVGLKALGKSDVACREEKKSAEWKLALGFWIKSQSGAPNRWLAERLKMGHPQTASRQMILYGQQRFKRCPSAKCLEETSKCSA